MDRDDVDDLAGVADDADAAVDELLLDRVVQDDLRGPRLREGEGDGVDAVVVGRVPDVPEKVGKWVGYTVRRSLGYLDWAGVLTKLLLGREFEPRQGTFSQLHQKFNAILV